MARILYIEDNPHNMDLVCRILKHVGGYEVVSATDGLSGVETAVREKPDLILMDINLPDISGLEATKRIKAVDELKPTPIVAFTADTGEGARQVYIEAGCDGFMAKPASAATLLQLVKKYV
jgi:two-component system, cell cycle response regulator DivK